MDYLAPGGRRERTLALVLMLGDRGTVLVAQWFTGEIGRFRLSAEEARRGGLGELSRRMTAAAEELEALALELHTARRVAPDEVERRHFGDSTLRQCARRRARGTCGADGPERCADCPVRLALSPEGSRVRALPAGSESRREVPPGLPDGDDEG